MADPIAQIEKLTQRLAQAKARQLMREAAQRTRAKRAQAKADAEARRADAHRKIVLGGLVIAAGVDEWNPAQICGALLWAAEVAVSTEDREALRQRGVAHLAAREAIRA